MYKILIADDHPLFREAIHTVITDGFPGSEVMETEDLESALALTQQHDDLDLILLDLNMPGMSGVETLQLLRQDCPDSAIVMLTVSEDAEDLSTALKAGASGYLLKNIDTDYLTRAIRRAAAGETVVAEAMTAKLVAQLQSGSVPPAASELDKLTPREREILDCLARGESNKGIARILDLAESTVKIHVQSVLKKLKLSSRVQAAVFAVEHRRQNGG